jgi:hypothetical protein
MCLLLLRLHTADLFELASSNGAVLAQVCVVVAGSHVGSHMGSDEPEH